MVDVVNEFESRLDQIRTCIDILESIENQEFSKRTDGSPYEFDSVFVNSVKWGLLIMAYNLAEYVVVTVVDRIYSDGFSWNDFHAFQDHLQAQFILDFNKAIGKRNNVSSICNFITRYLQDIKSNIVTCWYDFKKEIFAFKSISWNVSEEALKELSEIFGFSLPKKSKIAQPDKLGQLRDYRNSLAHWERSFNDVWQTISANSIRQDLELSAAYLRKLIDVVADFIKDEAYLKTPPVV